MSIWNTKEIDLNFKVINNGVDNGFTLESFNNYLTEIKEKVDEEIKEEIQLKDMRFTFDDEYAEYYIDKLGFCGCGCPQVALEAVLKVLFALKEWSLFTDIIGRRKEARFREFFGCDTNDFEAPACGLLLSVLYLLSDKGFTEHGSSIFGSWLTDEGERLLWSLAKDSNICQEAEVVQLEPPTPWEEKMIKFTRGF